MDKMAEDSVIVRLCSLKVFQAQIDLESPGNDGLTLASCDAHDNDDLTETSSCASSIVYFSEKISFTKDVEN